MIDAKLLDRMVAIDGLHGFGCSVADCEYLSRVEGGKCFAHSQGRNPVMTMQEYQSQISKPATEWKDSLGNLSTVALEAQRKAGQ